MSEKPEWFELAGEDRAPELPRVVHPDAHRDRTRGPIPPGQGSDRARPVLPVDRPAI